MPAKPSLIAVGFAAALGLTIAGMAWSQPAGVPGNESTQQLRVPRGLYRELVFTAVGTPDLAAGYATINYGGKQFPVAVPPGSTVRLSGWVFGKDATISVPSRQPFNNRVTHIEAWGLGDAGPVRFE